MDKVHRVLNDVQEQAFQQSKRYLNDIGISYVNGNLIISNDQSTITVMPNEILIKSPKITLKGNTTLDGKEIETK